MNVQARLAKLAAATGVGVATLAFIAAPQASAATSGEMVKAQGGADFLTDSGTLASCSNVFSGPVTSDNGSEIVASLNNVSFPTCSAGTRVTPNGVPWTMHLFGNSAFTIDGFDVNITTPQGTCRYAGDVRADMQFPGIDDLIGFLTRQTAGCGGPEQITVHGFPESVGTTN